MARFGSRAKGKIAEREIAKELELWWGRLEPGCRFRPTPMSGGWSSPDVRDAFKTGGDLVTTAQRWPFAVEVKRRENWNLENLKKGKKSPVLGWWRQAARAAAEMGLEPILIFRKNREEWWMMLRESWLQSRHEGMCLLRSAFNPEKGLVVLPFVFLLTAKPERFARDAQPVRVAIP